MSAPIVAPVVPDGTDPDASVSAPATTDQAQALAVRLHDHLHTDRATCTDTGNEPVFVGICMPRTLQALVAILATLRAGAAYICLETTEVCT